MRRLSTHAGITLLLTLGSSMPIADAVEPSESARTVLPSVNARVIREAGRRPADLPDDASLAASGVRTPITCR